MSDKLYPAGSFPDGHAAPGHTPADNIGAVLLASGRSAGQAAILEEALACNAASSTSWPWRFRSRGPRLRPRHHSSLHIYLSATARRLTQSAPTYARVWTERCRSQPHSASAATAALAAAAANPEVRPAVPRRQQTGHELACPAAATAAHRPRAQRRRDRRVNELTQDKQRLERDLVALLPEADRQQHSAPTRARRPGQGPAPRRRLCRSAALPSLGVRPQQTRRRERRWTACYVAFVVVQGRPCERVELGEAKPIEEALADWRHLIEQRKEQDSPSRRPSSVACSGSRSERCPADPDGLPGPRCRPDPAAWAALPGSKPGTILLEDHALAMVPHGPFLLEQLLDSGRFDQGTALGPGPGRRRLQRGAGPAGRRLSPCAVPSATAPRRLDGPARQRTRAAPAAGAVRRQDRGAWRAAGPTSAGCCKELPQARLAPPGHARLLQRAGLPPRTGARPAASRRACCVAGDLLATVRAADHGRGAEPAVVHRPGAGGRQPAGRRPVPDGGILTGEAIARAWICASWSWRC